MFTGIVEASVPVAKTEARGSGLRLWLPRPGISIGSAGPWDVAIGDSVAVSGCCLTVAALDPEAMLFDLSAETLERTWFERLEVGTPVNLERALRLSDRIGGHLVSGHVDGGGAVLSIEDVGDEGRELAFEVDEGLERYLVEKGSITIDGVSLTVCRPEGRVFTVALIPSTLEITTLGSAEVAQRVNVEVDMIGKWVERLAAPFS